MAKIPPDRHFSGALVDVKLLVKGNAGRWGLVCGFVCSSEGEGMVPRPLAARHSLDTHGGTHVGTHMRTRGGTYGGTCRETRVGTWEGTCGETHLGTCMGTCVGTHG